MRGVAHFMTFCHGKVETSGLDSLTLSHAMRHIYLVERARLFPMIHDQPFHARGFRSFGRPNLLGTNDRTSDY